MDKNAKPIVCERCGDEMAPSEQSRPDDTVCPWCQHMMLEAIDIYRKDARKRSLQLNPIEKRR